MPEKYTQILGLANIDVFRETENNDNSYFNIARLPRILSYGKHPFIITYNDPVGVPLLKNATNILFEFIDSRGTVIFTDIIDSDNLSGAANGYVVTTLNWFDFAFVSLYDNSTVSALPPTVCKWDALTFI